MAPTVGVMTMHRTKNYGSVLQAYATQEILRQSGADPFIIDFWRHDQRDGIADVLARSRWGRNRFTRAAYLALRGPAHERRRVVFNTFVDDHLELSPKSYHSITQLVEEPPDADIYCTGSDQTWNSDYNGASHSAYFLPFAPRGRSKFSLAASLGKERLSEAEGEFLRDHLAEFAHISVREASSVELLNARGVSATHLLDPTLLLPAEHWARLASENQSAEQYVLEYALNDNAELRHVSRAIARRDGLRVLRLLPFPGRTPSRTRTISLPRVSEWLSLFKHASVVVTDSFHGTAFSLNFNRPFYAIRPPKYAGRIESILDLVGLSGRLIDGESSISQQNPDFETTRIILNEERIKAGRFLRAAISNSAGVVDS